MNREFIVLEAHLQVLTVLVESLVEKEGLQGKTHQSKDSLSVLYRHAYQRLSVDLAEMAANVSWCISYEH